MLRVIASSAQRPALAGVDTRATAAAGRPPAARLLSPARPQETAVCRAPFRQGGRAAVTTKGINDEGDFGARDPYAGEIITGFASKPLGDADTDHVKRPPSGMEKILGLKAKHCTPCEGGAVPKLSPEEVEGLRVQVGWKLVTTAAGAPAIRYEWKVRNFTAAIDLFGRVAELAEAEGHHPDLHLTGYNNVTIELSTHAVGGLTLNDFIIASKINDLDFSDLMPKRKPRFWA